MNSSALKQQCGVGLIEVLITLLLLSTSLIALAALQMRSLQFNQGAYFHSQANILAYDILDRIRVNKRLIGNYSIALSAFAGGTAPTTPTYSVDKFEWQKDINTQLPIGKGGVECNAVTMLCKITISWGELNSSGQAAEDTSTYTYTARL